MKVCNGRDTEGFPDTFLLVQKLLTWPTRSAEKLQFPILGYSHPFNGQQR